jgi:hypothetical protein
VSSVHDSGEVDGSPSAGIPDLSSKSHGGGTEVDHFTSTAAIGPKGNISPGLTGLPKNDVATVSYSGTNNDEFVITAIGDGGNDNLSADVSMFPGSTGTVGTMNSPASIMASGKNDSLQFTIQDGNVPPTVADLNLFAVVQSRSRKDTIKKTTDLQSITPASVTVISQAAAGRTGKPRRPAAPLRIPPGSLDRFALQASIAVVDTYIRTNMCSLAPQAGRKGVCPARVDRLA